MKIAIKGHLTRGKEVIQILKSLGGKNNYFYRGYANLYYHIVPPDNIINTDIDIKHHRLYTLEEFEKEFPFKIGDKVTIIGISDFPKTITKMKWDCDEILYSFEGLVNTWFGAKALKKFEMKEERNITLTLEKAKEWYKKGGELKEIALQAFTVKELNPLPKSWEEFCEKYPIKKGECILEAKDRVTVAPCNFAGNRGYKNWIPSKESAEAHLAMIQLEQLRDCWRQGNIPQELKYKIRKIRNIYTVVYGAENAFLSFCDKQTAEEFLECFRDLIEKARDLI
jgi:hypothetical protein